MLATNKSHWIKLENMSFALVTAWMILFSISSRGLCDWDIRLTCPKSWYHGVNITLVCELNKNSLREKCVYKTNNTDFKLNDIRICVIDQVGYGNCSKNPTGDQSSCTCQENSTFFSFLYHFTANKSQHNGKWTCVDACFDSTKYGYPLTENDSQYCQNVTVIDKDVPDIPDGGSIIRTLILMHLLALIMLILEVFRY